MKKAALVVVTGLLLVGAYFAGVYIVESTRKEKLEEAATKLPEALVRDYSMRLGNESAKVYIVEFFDPGCETCRVFAEHVKRIMSKHPGKTQLVLRYAPFHQGADVMCRILEASRAQGRYWEVLQVMFDTQPQWASHHHPQPDRIWEFLPMAGVDVAKIREDMNHPDIIKRVQQDMADVQTLGVRKTPEFIVNGKRMPSFGLQQLETLIDGEVAAAYGASK